MKLLTSSCSTAATLGLFLASSLPFGASYSPFHGSNSLAKRFEGNPFNTFSAEPPKKSTAGGNRFRFLTSTTQPFLVDGKNIPDVGWDVGESYAGLIPISKIQNEDKKLFFWFFPKRVSSKLNSTILASAIENSLIADDDALTIWLNGGPGCSSLEGMFQENGPFLWQYGSFKPVPNPFAWTNLTNMIYVEQPVGTGYTQGTPTIRSAAEGAEEFLGFFENFIDTFQLYNKRIYIAGESYAGTYIPYIADAFYKRKELAKPSIADFGLNRTRYFDLRGTLIYDPHITDFGIEAQIPIYPFVKYWEKLFAFDSKTMALLEEIHEKCGYKAWYEKYFTFPPQKGGMPTFDFPGKIGSINCDIWAVAFNAQLLLNPCFNAYHITDTCPVLWDVLGFPGSFAFLPEGAKIYFNRLDVKKAINAPLNTTWEECTTQNVFFNGTDISPFPALEVLPRVIEKSERTIISHGLLDYYFVSNGTLMAIQNMTWNGMTGFQQEPRPQSFVLEAGRYGKQRGVFGKVHEERGLTWVEVEGSGHMGPQYQPAVAYKLLEYLLGKRKNL